MSFSSLIDAALGVITENLGEDIEYAGETIKGVYSASYLEHDLNTGIAVETSSPNVMIRLSDLETAPAQGDEVVVREVTYKVARIQPDGEGAARIFLHRTS